MGNVNVSVNVDVEKVKLLRIVFNLFQQDFVVMLGLFKCIIIWVECGVGVFLEIIKFIVVVLDIFFYELFIKYLDWVMVDVLLLFILEIQCFVRV